MQILWCPKRASQRGIQPALKCITCRHVFNHGLFLLIRETNEFPNNHIMRKLTPFQNEMAFVLMQLPRGRRKKTLPAHPLQPSFPLSPVSFFPLFLLPFCSLAFISFFLFCSQSSSFLLSANIVSRPALGTDDPPVAWQAPSSNVLFCHRSGKATPARHFIPSWFTPNTCSEASNQGERTQVHLQLHVTFSSADHRLPKALESFEI